MTANIFNIDIFTLYLSLSHKSCMQSTMIVWMLNKFAAYFLTLLNYSFFLPFKFDFLDYWWL